MKFWAFVLFFLFNLQTESSAQAIKKFFSIGVDEGLSQNSVWNAFQDYKGFMWLATSDGISRYDGYNIKQYHANPKDPYSIHGVSIYQFFEDKNKTLWIIHENGISYYERGLDRFHKVYSYKSNPTTKGFIGDDQTGGLWAYSVDENMLLRVNINTKKIDNKIIVENKQKKDYSFQHLEKIGSVYYLEIYDDEILSIDFKKLNIEKIKIPIAKARSFGVLNENTLFRIVDNTRYDYDIINKRWSTKNIEASKFNHHYYAFDYLFWEGNYYIASVDGLYIYNSISNKYSDHITSFSENSVLGFTYIQKLNTDNSGNLWICTNGDGVKCLSKYRNKFPHLKSMNRKTNMIKSICVGADGAIYCGTFEDGIIRFDSNGLASKVNINYIDKNEIKSVLCLKNYDDKHLIFVHYNKIYTYNIYTHQTKYLGQTLEQLTSFPSIQKYNNKWYINTNEHIYEFNERQKLKRVIGINSTYISCYNIIDDAIWIGTADGLYVYNLTNKETKRISKNNFVKDISKGFDEHIFVSNTNGLYVYNNKAELVKKYDVSTGLANSFIYGCLKDYDSSVWVSHNKGLSKINIITNQIINYNKNDGLQSNEFNTGAFYKSNLGIMYFGGVNGINIINSKNTPTNNTAPLTAITKINILDDAYKSDSNVNEIQQINLDYFENTISFEFSALEYSNTEENLYAYQLEGIDKNWINSGTKHFTRYTNLPAGKYCFKIKSANADGVWSKDVKTIVINITPPYYQTLPFYIVSGIFILALLALIFYLINRQQRINMRRKLQVQIELENERLRISRDLHDNVGAQLSFLITNMEWMISNVNNLSKEEEVSRLSKLTESGREAIQTLRQTIWAISKQELSVEEFADRYKQFSLKLMEMSNLHKIDFKDEIIYSENLSPALALNLFRICQESLNNCLKHSHAKNIWITFKCNTEYLFYFEIKDDGVGFNINENMEGEHYGLKNMKTRAKDSNADFAIDSTIGKGTVVSLNIRRA